MELYVKILQDDNLIKGIAYLFCREMNIDRYKIPAPTDEVMSTLNQLNFKYNQEIGYICYEYYRQSHEPDVHDCKIRQMAQGKSKILDLCCGPGATLTTLQEANPDVLYAFDHNDKYISMLTELAEGKNKSNVIARKADAHNIPLESESVDFTVNRVSLQYLNVEVVINEMHRVLEKNGQLFLSVHGPGYVMHYLRRKATKNAIKLLFKGVMYNLFGKQFYKGELFLMPFRLKKILESKGFSDIQINSTGSFPLYFSIAARK